MGAALLPMPRGARESSRLVLFAMAFTARHEVQDDRVTLLLEGDRFHPEVESIWCAVVLYDGRILHEHVDVSGFDAIEVTFDRADLAVGRHHVVWEHDPRGSRIPRGEIIAEDSFEI
jgi:hypothetical protein